MDSSTIVRRLRGALGTAVVWGACWCVATFVVSALFALAGRGFSWTGTWQLAARLSVVGGLTGTAFSTFIGLAYRGRRLSEISWVRFGIGGGILAGLFVPTFMLVARTLGGDGPLALANYAWSGLLAAVFGTVSAGASMKLAQGASGALPGEDAAESLESGDPLGSMGPASSQGSKAPAQPTREE